MRLRPSRNKKDEIGSHLYLIAHSTGSAGSAGSATLNVEVVGNDHRVGQWHSEQALGEVGGLACCANSSGIKDRVSAGDGNGCGGGLTEGVDLHGHHDTAELTRRQRGGRIGGGDTVPPRGMGTILAGTSCRAGSSGNGIAQAFL